jgi:hypothetical protein
METYAEIQEVLVELGEVLTFPTFTIYGINELDRGFLDMQEGYSQVEHIEYQIIVSSKDCATHAVVVGNTFTTTDTVYTYNFKVQRPHIPYGDGWSRLPINLVSKVAL